VCCHIHVWHHLLATFLKSVLTCKKVVIQLQNIKDAISGQRET
jgi:hypothetical protein